MAPNELLVVENMLEDERFQNNPLVTQAPNLRFYAGAPLINLQGYALGTIAVADTVPRRFTPQEGEILKDFSKLVVSTLEHRSKASQYQKLALTDQLTGLPNRSNFERTLDLQIAHSSRTGDPFSLFYMDLNQFKMVNDTYGHAAGDEVLARVAQAMLSQLRAGDMLARLGGDEFGMIVRGSAEETSQPLMQRISEVVAKPIMLSNGKQVSIGISIGNVAYSELTGSLDKIMAQADKALYRNKRG
jgi:diguanylate cyclase (GGDEF)-like protein